MATAFLTRKVHFTAAHRYYRTEWSEARNREVFGASSNPHGHGHNYLLEVRVRGEIDAETGFAVDIGALNAALEREVVQAFGHRHLNHAVDAFREGGLVPTTENILAYPWPRLAVAIPGGAQPQRPRMHKDDTFYVDYFGGNPRAGP